jgi:nitroreductase
MNSIIPALQWRYSLKQFSSRSIAPSHLESLVEAARLSASSYGLQPYQVWVVEERSLLAKLAEAAYGQEQLKSCSHLLVFANETSIGDSTVDDYFARYYQQTNTTAESLAGYAEHIKAALRDKTQQQRLAWAEQQAYLGLGSVLCQAAVLGIDSCPMTGFEQAAVNQILSLGKHNLSASVICALGYREADATPPSKVRKEKAEFVHYVGSLEVTK